MPAVFNANEHIVEAQRIVRTEGYSKALLYLAEQEVAARAVDVNASLFLKSNRAKMLNQAHRPEEALALCDKALEKHPERTAFLRIKRSALLYLGQAQEAREILDRLKVIEPERDHSMTFGETTDQFMEALPVENAESAAEAVAYLCGRFGPKPLEIIVMLNEATKPENFGEKAATVKGAYDGFLPRLATALEKKHEASPTDLGCLIALAFVYRGTHEMPRMRKAFQDAYHLAPEKETTMYGEAVRHEYGSQQRRTVLAKLHDRYPNPAYGYMLATELMAADNVTGAIRTLKGVVATRPQHKDANVLLVKAHLLAHEYRDAEKLLGRDRIPQRTAEQLRIFGAFMRGNHAEARTRAVSLLAESYDRTMASIAMVSILRQPDLLHEFEQFLAKRNISSAEFKRAQQEAQALAERENIGIGDLVDHRAARHSISSVYGQAHLEPYGRQPLANIGRKSYRPGDKDRISNKRYPDRRREP